MQRTAVSNAPPVCLNALQHTVFTAGRAHPGVVGAGKRPGRSAGGAAKGRGEQGAAGEQGAERCVLLLVSVSVSIRSALRLGWLAFGPWCHAVPCVPCMQRRAVAASGATWHVHERIERQCLNVPCIGLLSQEARDHDGNTPLWWAAAHGRTDMVRLLAAAGADREARDQKVRLGEGGTCSNCRVCPLCDTRDTSAASGRGAAR